MASLSSECEYLRWGQLWEADPLRDFSGEIALVNENAPAEKLILAFDQDTDSDLNS